jgi:hypothetical protein
MSASSTCQDTDYARHIQEILDELGQIQQTPRLVTSPGDLEALAHEIRQRTDHLGSLLSPIGRGKTPAFTEPLVF